MVYVERIKQYIDEVEPENFDGPLTVCNLPSILKEKKNFFFDSKKIFSSDNAGMA